jgi:hypothetical protein
MARRMLCSGTGGPVAAEPSGCTCPVCGRDTFGDPAAVVVPRHFIQAGDT